MKVKDERVNLKFEIEGFQIGFIFRPLDNGE